MKKKSRIVILCVATLLALVSGSFAQTFMCTSNPDYFTKRCTIHPNAITRVVNGMIEKGHLVGCQYKSYSCIKVDGKYQCRDNYGTTMIPFDFPMSDLKSFCNLLCTAPSCTGTWE